MAVQTHQAQVTSPVSAARLFDGFVVKDLPPVVLPNIISHVETLEGDGGPGTIKLSRFVEGFIKLRVDGLDKENFTYSYTITDGAAVTDKVGSISFELKFEPSDDGGSVVTIDTTYHLKGDAEITPEEASDAGGKVAMALQAVSGYMVTHPDA